MRHRIRQRKLNRTSEHRLALHRNLAQSLIEHGLVTTTLPKAKDIRPFVEKVVTLAIKVRAREAEGDAAGGLRARRRIYKMLGDRAIIPAEHRFDYAAMTDARRAKTLRSASGRRYRTGEPKGRLAFTAESVGHRLIESIAPRFEDRPGGYTRLIRLPKRRIGDNAPLAIVQFVGDEEVPKSLTKAVRTARKRRADARYKMAIRAQKKGGRAGEATTKPPADADKPVEPTDSQNGTTDGADAAS